MDDRTWGALPNVGCRPDDERIASRTYLLAQSFLAAGFERIEPLLAKRNHNAAQMDNAYP